MCIEIYKDEQQKIKEIPIIQRTKIGKYLKILLYIIL